jgi:hypothetical protein
VQNGQTDIGSKSCLSWLPRRLRLRSFVTTWATEFRPIPANTAFKNKKFGGADARNSRISAKKKAFRRQGTQRPHR